MTYKADFTGKISEPRVAMSGFFLALICSIALTWSPQINADAYGDRVTELEYSAKELARTGQKDRAVENIGQAIELAKSMKRPEERVQALVLKRTCMLIEFGWEPQALHAVRDVLERKGMYLKLASREPEIQVELDELADTLSRCGGRSSSPSLLAIGVELAQAFPNLKNNAWHTAMLEQLFEHHASRRQWAQAEAVLVRFNSCIEPLRPTSKAQWWARHYRALKEQHKDKEAAAVYAKLCRDVSPHPRESGGWYIHLAHAAYDAGDLKLARTAADKAVERCGPISPAGSYGVSEAYNIRATINLKTKQFAAAESDARMSLKGSIGVAQGEAEENSKLLEEALRAQNKHAEAIRVKQQRTAGNKISF